MLYYKGKNGGIKMGYQIYCGKGFDTQKAERFFKERRVSYQRVDVLKYGIGKRELESVVFPRAGPTILVPFRNMVNARTVPTRTITTVINAVIRSNCTEIFHTRIRKKNAIPPDNIPIPTGRMLPHSDSNFCGINM